MTERDRPVSETETEVTAAMIDAGVIAYAEEAGHDPSDAMLRLALRAAFIAMLKERRKSLF